MRKRAVIGIDIGGTKTLCALVTQQFKIIKEVKFKTAPQDGRATFSKRLAKTVKGLVAEADKQHLHLVGIGIASAGRIDRANSSTSPCGSTAAS